MDVARNWFEVWFSSPYYQQLYFQRNETEAAAFISRLIEYLRPPADSFMMDVACGRGRHARILASFGFDVSGIDLSFENILEAGTYESEKLHFFQHDLRLPFWMNYFNYAFNFFSGFGYYRTEREHYNAIRTISHSLKPGGILVVDYLNAHYTEDHLVHKEDNEIDGVHFHITRWFNETHFIKKIQIEDEKLKEPAVFQEQLAKFSLGDFNDMFAFHHLQIQEVFGDYGFGAYDVKKSPRLIMVATKV